MIKAICRAPKGAFGCKDMVYSCEPMLCKSLSNDCPNKKTEQRGDRCGCCKWLEQCYVKQNYGCNKWEEISI